MDRTLLLHQLEQVEESGSMNMRDMYLVRRRAYDLDLDELVNFLLKEGKEEYWELLDELNDASIERN